jgi:hypothetical protein
MRVEPSPVAITGPPPGTGFQAARALATGFPGPDVLVNNAGVARGPRQCTGGGAW